MKMVLRYRVRQTEFFAILDHFLPFYAPNNPQKNEKTTHNIIILHVYVILQNVTDRIFHHFGSFFALLPTNNQQNQNFVKMKKTLEILSVCTSVPEMTIISCMVPDIWSMTDRSFCHFGLYFALLPH